MYPHFGSLTHRIPVIRGNNVSAFWITGTSDSNHSRQQCVRALDHWHIKFQSFEATMCPRFGSLAHRIPTIRGHNVSALWITGTSNSSHSRQQRVRALDHWHSGFQSFEARICLRFGSLAQRIPSFEARMYAFRSLHIAFQPLQKSMFLSLMLFAAYVETLR